jgi:hypothetical protein
MKRVIVQNHAGEKRIVQESMIPRGFEIIKEHKEPKKKPNKE